MNPWLIAGASVGAYLVGPTIVNAAVAILKPVAKEVIKAGMVAYDGLAEIVNETTEVAREAKTELNAGRQDGSARDDTTMATALKQAAGNKPEKKVT